MLSVMEPILDLLELDFINATPETTEVYLERYMLSSSASSATFLGIFPRLWEKLSPPHWMSH